jgi:two-component system response regulator (stage 0 sporulation protein A)
MKIKVLVVDDSAVHVQLLKKYFNGSEKIEIVGSASNGEEYLRILEEGKVNFDILILDLVMPLLDGFDVLSYMNEHNIDKKVIVMTSFNEEETIRKVSEFGVKYYALKPFDLKKLEDIIIDINNSIKSSRELIELQDKGLQIKVTNLLHALGIPSHIKGYQYIRSAILMVYDNPSFIGGITKQLYPDLSIKFNTSTERVERAIRHAIEVSWNRGDIDLMENIFGHSVDIDRSKPTNSEFIVTIADKLRLDMIRAN